MRSRPKHGKESGRIERYSLKKRLQEDYRRLQEISAQSANSARRRVDHAGRPVGPHQRPGGTKATAIGGRSFHTVIFSVVRPKQTPNRSRDVRFLLCCERVQTPRAADQAHSAKEIGAYRIRSSLEIVSLSRVLRIARVWAAISDWLVLWTTCDRSCGGPYKWAWPIMGTKIVFATKFSLTDLTRSHG